MNQSSDDLLHRAVSGTIDDAFRAFESETGLPASGADLLFADPYTVLSEGVESAAYLGTAYVDGIECHHLAFRETGLTGNCGSRPARGRCRLRYVITSTWHTAAPQLEVSLRGWNTSPKITDEQFVFSVPAGARKLEAMPSEDIDDVPQAKEGQ